MLPLAVLCHQSDIWSARCYPNNPLIMGLDFWGGASRHNEEEDLIGYIKELSKFKS